MDISAECRAKFMYIKDDYGGFMAFLAPLIRSQIKGYDDAYG